MAISGGTGGPNVQVPNTPQIGEPKEYRVVLTLADDKAAVVPVPYASGKGQVEVSSGDGLPARLGAIAFTTIGGAAAAAAFTGALGTDVDAATGVLADAGGVDANLTVSAHTDGNLYVSNRLGATKTIYLTFRP